MHPFTAHVSTRSCVNVALKDIVFLCTKLICIYLFNWSDLNTFKLKLKVELKMSGRDNTPVMQDIATTVSSGTDNDIYDKG